MTIQLPALGGRASTIATVGAVVLAALVVTARADAAGTRATPVLAEGAGMGAKPSAPVRQVQRALEHRGYDVGAPGVDGRFGPLTARAVRRLQAARGLAVDGLVGARTRAALGLRRRAATARKPTSSRAQKTASPARESTPAEPSAAPRAATPAPITVLDPATSRSPGTLETVLFWAAIGALAAFGLAWLVRRGSAGEPHPAPVAGAAPVPTRRLPRAPMIGYVSTPATAWSDEHERSAAAIEAVCERSAWELLDIVWDRENGASGRPGLSHACERIANGQARGLVVSDLRRVSRSPQEMGALMAFFRDVDATLVALDLDLDTSTPGGRHVANSLIALGRHGRELSPARAHRG